MSASGIDAPAAARAFERAFAPRGGLYCVFDAARAPEARSEAEAAGVECRHLFAGALGNLLEEVAPHIAEFPIESSVAAWWFGEWGNSAGILVESDEDLSALRQHFRTLMIVRDAERRRYYFRFFDPRVLAVFLPACSAAELERFFGPITAIYCELDGGGQWVNFSRDADGGLISKTITVL